MTVAPSIAPEALEEPGGRTAACAAPRAGWSVEGATVAASLRAPGLAWMGAGVGDRGLVSACVPMALLLFDPGTSSGAELGGPPGLTQRWEESTRAIAAHLEVCTARDTTTPSFVCSRLVDARGTHAAAPDPMSAQGLPVGSVFAQLRIRSGLSRDQVAALFGADRTQLARWVSGGPVPAHHEVRARRLLALVRGLEGGVAQVRDRLLGDLQGRPVVDWLRDGRVGEVAQALGAGPERVPPRPRPLTPAEEAAIWPLSLDVMLLPLDHLSQRP